MAAKPKLAVFKFASCDGCQLSLLDAEDELLAVAGAVEIAYFLEARTQVIAGPVRRRAGRRLDHHGPRRRADQGDPPAVQVPGDHRRLRHGRRHPGPAELGQRRRVHPAASMPIRSTSRRWTTSTPIADHVLVDFELRGCPINKYQLLELVSALLRGRQADGAQVQRLPGVQAAADGLRRRGAGHRLPGPGDPGRLRRDLPGLQPRVLRLLRPEGAAQPGEPGEPLR